MKLQFLEKYLREKERTEEEKEMVSFNETFYNKLVFLALKEIDEYWYFQLRMLENEYTYLENIVTDQLPMNVWADTMFKTWEALDKIYDGKLPKPDKKYVPTKEESKDYFKSFYSVDNKDREEENISFNITDISPDKHDTMKGFDNIEYMLLGKTVRIKDDNREIKVLDVFHDGKDIKVYLSDNFEMYLWEFYDKYDAPRTIPVDSIIKITEQKNETRIISLKTALLAEKFEDVDVYDVYLSYDKKYQFEGYPIPVTLVCFIVKNGKEKEELTLQKFTDRYKIIKQLDTYDTLIEQYKTGK